MAERNSGVFADSNYFIALANENDSLHKQAILISQNLEERAVQLFLSNLIFLEVITVLSQKRGREVANKTGLYLLSDPHISYIHIDEQLHEESWHIFQSISQKNIGFVDCSIIAAMKAEDISTLLTFDKADFKQLQKPYGFRLYEE
jgi:uncharacterized protein